MAYPHPCHYQSVDLKVPHQPLIPWKHLNSRDYAQFLYKWYKIVRINRGDSNEWGNWGTEII